MSLFNSTFIYGALEVPKRQEVWQLLEYISASRNGDAWFLAGDFNEITDNSEKSGGKERPESSFSHFRSFLSACDLLDIRHTGNFLSWRGQRHTHLIHCRLDRAMANSEWYSMFPNGRSHYLPLRTLTTDPYSQSSTLERKKLQKLFKYDRRLRENTEIKKLIDKFWRESNHLQISERIVKCRKAISAWSREHYVNSQKLITELWEKLDKAMTDQIADDAYISLLNKSLLSAYKAEENYWKQRSRQIWLALGDRNTTYFHASTKRRRARNKITVIEDTLGNPVFEDDQIAKAISEYYSAIFTSINPPAADLVHQTLSPCISETTNEKLIVAPSLMEIKAAVFSIDPDKVSGPYGFSASFSQSNWDTVEPAIAT